MIEKELKLYLDAQVPLTDLIGTAPVRLFPLALRQGETMPAITYQRLSGGYDHMLAGGSGMANPRFRFAVYDDDYLGAKNVAKALRDELQGFGGVGKLFGTTKIHSVQIVDEVDEIVEPPDGSEVPYLYIVRCDFLIQHEETIPAP